MFKPTSPPGNIKECEWCHRPYTSTKDIQRFCTGNCKRANRKHIRRFVKGWKEPDYHKRSTK